MSLSSSTYYDFQRGIDIFSRYEPDVEWFTDYDGSPEISTEEFPELEIEKISEEDQEELNYLGFRYYCWNSFIDSRKICNWTY